MADAKLGGAIKEKLGIPCVFDESALQLTRGLRNQIESLVEAASASEMKSMAIGLAHSLSRYKLKFSPDKVDTMIVQVPLALPRAYAPATELPHVNTADRGGRAGDVYREYLTICISCISDDVRGSSEGALTVGRVGAGLRPPDRGAIRPRP